MTRERRTKIVCTIGPASQNEDTLREMMQAGMDVARLNFSHGSYEYHLASIELVRRVADDLGANVAVMVDTKGPEIRTRPWEGRTPVSLEAGQHVMVTTRTDFADDEPYVRAMWQRFYVGTTTPGRDRSQRGYDLRTKWRITAPRMARAAMELEQENRDELLHQIFELIKELAPGGGSSS